MLIARRAFQRAINDFCFYRIAVIFYPFPRKSRVSLRVIIARRAFLSLTFIQATLHACIPACDSTFPKFNRITVYFCSFSLLHRTFPQIKNARPCDLCSRFVRAIARFQRKFSANHAKSAYFQRKSRKVSVNNHLPHIMMPAQLWKSHSGRTLCVSCNSSDVFSFQYISIFYSLYL